MDADGTIIFLPDADYFGRATGFAYTAGSASGVSASAWADVEVLNVQDTAVVSADLDEFYEACAA